MINKTIKSYLSSFIISSFIALFSDSKMAILFAKFFIITYSNHIFLILIEEDNWSAHKYIIK
jgi:hypothetical protein